MLQEKRITVALDQTLVQSLLNGLHKGAMKKSLKVTVNAQGNFHVESKDIRMLVELDASGKKIGHIHLHNDKLAAEITAENLEKLGCAALAESTARELKDKYSPFAHSLADSVHVFAKTYI